MSFVDTEGVATRQRSKTIDELWDMWTRGERNGHALAPHQEAHIERLATEGKSLRFIARETGVGRRAVTRHLREGSTAYRSARTRLMKMKVRVLNEDTNEFETGRIAEIVDKGVQPVYRLTLADGRQLQATENHRILTDLGWKTLREAVALEGAVSGARMTRRCAVVTNGKAAYSDYEWMNARRERGLSRRSSVELPDSLPQRKGWKLTGHAVQVIAVDYVGFRKTYDLAIEGPWHNFVANGIVVHNSFNEESARYHKLADDFYIPTSAAVRSQVGKPGAYSFEPVEEAIAAETIDTFQRVYKELYAEYLRLIERGVAKELARALLPFGIFTQFYWTLNARALMNFLSLRNSEFAQYEIRMYAEAVERLFRQKMPITHECFVEFGRRGP